MDKIRYEQMIRRSEKRHLRDLRRQKRSRRAAEAAAKSGQVAPPATPKPLEPPSVQSIEAKPRERKQRRQCGGCGKQAEGFRNATTLSSRGIQSPFQPPKGITIPTLAGKSSRPPIIMPKK